MFRPTDEQRRTVKALSGYGVPQEGIAIDVKTLRGYFQDELDRGSVEATAKVAQTLFHLATVEKNVASVIFWMKARAGWREKQEVVVSTEDERANTTDQELLARIKAKIAELEAPPMWSRIANPASESVPVLRPSPPCSTPTNDR